MNQCKINSVELLNKNICIPALSVILTGKSRSIEEAWRCYISESFRIFHFLKFHPHIEMAIARIPLIDLTFPSIPRKHFSTLVHHIIIRSQTFPFPNWNEIVIKCTVDFQHLVEKPIRLRARLQQADPLSRIRTGDL